MAIYARLVDYEEATGRPVPAELGHTIDELLDEAEVRLAAYAGDLAGRVASGLTSLERLRTAVVGMVAEALRSQEAQRLLAHGTSTAAERAALRQTMTVGRRERALVGMRPAAFNLSLSAADGPLWRSPCGPEGLA